MVTVGEEEETQKDRRYRRVSALYMYSTVPGSYTAFPVQPGSSISWSSVMAETTCRICRIGLMAVGVMQSAALGREKPAVMPQLRRCAELHTRGDHLRLHRNESRSPTVGRLEMSRTPGKHIYTVLRKCSSGGLGFGFRASASRAFALGPCE